MSRSRRPVINGGGVAQQQRQRPGGLLWIDLLVIQAPAPGFGARDLVQLIEQVLKGRMRA